LITRRATGILRTPQGQHIYKMCSSSGSFPAVLTRDLVPHGRRGRSAPRPGPRENAGIYPAVCICCRQIQEL